MEGREALSVRAGEVRFFAGGGLPPPSHEELLVGPDGTARYVTAMPWPAQPPFDEIGAYRATADTRAVTRLRQAAAAVLAVAPTPTGSADVGLEGVQVDGAEGYWSQDVRPAAAPGLVDAAREIIAAVRDRPWAAVRGGVRGDGVELVGRGERALTVRDGEVRAGWGIPGDPPSPLDLAARPPSPVTLPAQLRPGDVVALALPDPGPAPCPDARVHALVHLRLRSPLDDGWLDGWLIAGPA